LFSGSPRVEGDEEDDGIDDLDFEFDYSRSGLESETFSRRNSEFDLASAPPGSQIPLLTYGEEVGSYFPQSLLLFYCPFFIAHFGCFSRTLKFLLIVMLSLFLHHLAISIGFINLIFLTPLVSFIF